MHSQTATPGGRRAGPVQWTKRFRTRPGREECDLGIRGKVEKEDGMMIAETLPAEFLDYRLLNALQEQAEITALLEEIYYDPD